MPAVRATSTWRRGARTAADAMATLGAGRRIAADLRSGLAGPGVAAAAGGLRALLGVAAVGLGGLDGDPLWSGPAPEAATELVERVRERDARAARGPAGEPGHHVDPAVVPARLPRHRAEKEKADPARYAEMEVRSLTGVGAAKATVH